MSSIVSTPTTHSPQCHRPRLDQASMGSVAVEGRVLEDDRAVADGEQVGAYGHILERNRNASANPCAQRSQVEYVERRTDGQG